MARPAKQTVDYFSHDANASDGRTITILENHYGAEGYAAWFKLLERLSTANNHVIRCRNGDDIEFLSAKMKLKPERLEEILNKLAEIDAIDPELWEQKIIWSQKFVDRLVDVYNNRRQDLPERPVSTDNNLVSTPDNPVSSVETIPPKITHDCTIYTPPKSKLKYTKGNESKAKEILQLLVDEGRYDEVRVDEAHSLKTIIQTFKDGGVKHVLNHYRSQVEGMGLDLDAILKKELGKKEGK